MGNDNKELSQEVEDLMMGSDNQEAKEVETNEEEQENNSSTNSNTDTEETSTADSSNEEENKTEKKPEEEKEKDSKKEESIKLTEKQKEIIGQAAVLEKEIKDLEEVSVDETEFYENLDDHLTEEEAYLEETNKAEYLKVVDSKKKEWLEKNSNKDKIEEKKQELQNLATQSAIEDGISEITKIYPEYNHEEMAKFAQMELTKKEIDEINSKSTTFTDTFKLTYEKYLEKSGKPNPTIKETKAPDTPKTDDITKQTVKDNEIEAVNSEDENYRSALGLD